MENPRCFHSRHIPQPNLEENDVRDQARTRSARQEICNLLEENGVPGYHRETDQAYHRANAWEYIASPPGNWPYISVDCQHHRAIVMTPDFDCRQTRSFCLFLTADLTALVAHVKHLHETWDDKPWTARPPGPGDCRPLQAVWARRHSVEPRRHVANFGIQVAGPTPYASSRLSTPKTARPTSGPASGSSARNARSGARSAS